MRVSRTQCKWRAGCTWVAGWRTVAVCEQWRTPLLLCLLCSKASRIALLVAKVALRGIEQSHLCHGTFRMEWMTYRLLRALFSSTGGRSPSVVPALLSFTWDSGTCCLQMGQWPLRYLSSNGTVVPALLVFTSDSGTCCLHMDSGTCVTCLHMVQCFLRYLFSHRTVVPVAYTWYSAPCVTCLHIGQWYLLPSHGTVVPALLVFTSDSGTCCFHMGQWYLRYLSSHRRVVPVLLSSHRTVVPALLDFTSDSGTCCLHMVQWSLLPSHRTVVPVAYTWTVVPALLVFAWPSHERVVPVAFTWDSGTSVVCLHTGHWYLCCLPTHGTLVPLLFAYTRDTGTSVACLHMGQWSLRRFPSHTFMEPFPKQGIAWITCQWITLAWCGDDWDMGKWNVVLQGIFPKEEDLLQQRNSDVPTRVSHGCRIHSACTLFSYAVSNSECIA
jgi:hypothetical protein